LGLLLGLVTGLLRLSRNPLITAPLVACTPLLVQIVWFYYALPVILGIDISAHVAAVLVLSLYTGAFYAEIVRSGVNSIERGQWDAARAIGMRRRQLMRHIALSQAVKRIIPPLYEPVDHSAEEYLAGVDDCSRRSAQSRDAHHRRDLPKPPIALTPIQPFRLHGLHELKCPR
jgi:His/Glu/Gln/Arg/opine family amino acid ABC transporter permease subunit